MLKTTKITFLTLSFISFLLFSCYKKKIDTHNFNAYFGGEIFHPESGYILLYNNNEFMDTLFLNANHKFGKRFDSLAPGMYIIKHGNHCKYVFFDKNDSLFARINTQNFENTSSFFGIGKDKNNFLLEMFSLSLSDYHNFTHNFAKPYQTFRKSADSLKDSRTALYLRRKTEIGWKNDFDKYILCLIDLDYYSRLESYPYVHQNLTGIDIRDSLPEHYYDFREKIDLNDSDFCNFRPFTRYLTIRISSDIDKNEYKTNLEKNLAKLKMADSLIKNESIKDRILTNLAFGYFMEDQNISNNNVFLSAYKKRTKDKILQKEIIDIKNSISRLTPNHILPEVKLTDKNLNPVTLSDVAAQKKTVIFFWSNQALNHFDLVYQKVLELSPKYKDVLFVSVNLDSDTDEWQETISRRVHHPNIIEIQAKDFDEVRNKWAVVKLNRTIILQKNGKIKNAFTSLSDNHFEDEL